MKSIKLDRFVGNATIRSLLIVLIIATPIWAQKIAVKGETVYTMAGDPIQNGVVLIKNGKIERVGPEI